MNEGVADCGRASNGRYVQGCRCDACRHAHVVAWKARELRNLTGDTYFVDAAPVRERLLALYAMGYSRKELARFGISKSTQYALVHRHNRSGRPLARVRRETAERLEAVQGRRLARRQLVPADAAALMVRRWHGGGVPLVRIARSCGLNRQAVDNLYHGRSRQVRAETLAALLAHREELDDMARPAPRRSNKDTLSATLSDWEVEEAYARHRSGAALSVLAMQYHTNAKHLRRAFGRLEKRGRGE